MTKQSHRNFVIALPLIFFFLYLIPQTYLSYEAKDDLNYYKANLAVAAKNEVEAGQNAVAAATRVGTSAETLGFYAGGELSLEGSKSTFNQTSTSSVASTISAGNGVSLTAGGNTLIQGSHLAAGNFIAIDTDTLDIVASKNTSRTRGSSQSVSASIGFDTAGVTGGSVGGSISRDSSKSTTYNNSSLSASNISLRSKGDTNIVGANFAYDKSMNVDVGGNLHVESKQDSHSERSVGVSANVGFTNDIDKKATANRANGNSVQTSYVRTGNTNTSGSVNAHLNKGNFQAVTNQTNLNGDGKLTVTVAGNTHLVGASMEGKLGTDFTTGTLTTEDIENKASYQSMSAGVNYSANSSDKGSKSTGGFSPTIGLPQDKSKHSTTQASIGENTKLTITNQAAQTQDVSQISRDTKTSGFAMTEINTEVIGIRSDLSAQASEAGFKKVGDLAMEQDWQDGSIEKTLAHAAVGAAVAAIGNGDALNGALGAGAAEATRPITSKSDTGTQETVSTFVGALAGGGTGASVGLDGEKFNRQLHQKEIKWIEEHAGAFAKELYGDNPTPEELADAKARLAQQSLRQVDKGWSLKLGSQTDEDAKSFLSKNDAKLFTVKDEYEFKDGSTDGENEISDLSKKDFNTLSSFYNENINRATTTNPDGTLRNANENYANEKGLIDALKEGKIGLDEFNQALRDLVPSTIQSIGDIPDTANSAVNFLDAALPTTNQERLDTLYGSHTDGSVLQANIATNDAITTGAMITGVGAVGRAGVNGIIKNIDNGVDDALDVNLERPNGMGEAGNAAILDDVKQELASGKDLTVSAEEFKESLSQSKHTEMLTNYTVEELENMKLVKLPNNNIGYALKDFEAPDGTIHKNGELVAVHNNDSAIRGIGNDLMQHATGQGAMALDHFDTGILSNLYSSYGFKEYQRFSYDPKYDLDGSFKNKYGEVDVVYRMRETQQKSTENPSVFNSTLQVDVKDLKRSHSISGNGSSKKVDKISKDMKKNGYNANEPIQVVESNNELYIVDGHHRAAAARRINTPVTVEKLTDEEVKTSKTNYNSIDDVVKSAEEVEPDKLTPPNKYKTKRSY